MSISPLSARADHHQQPQAEHRLSTTAATTTAAATTAMTGTVRRRAIVVPGNHPFATNTTATSTSTVFASRVAAPVRARTGPPALLVFFIFLSINCLLSSLSTSNSSSYSTSLLLIHCDANPRNINTNQRVDAPSPDDFPPLTGPDFAFTPQTPLGNLTDPREYADGALATQKLVAAPLIPIDRQMWVGVDTRTAYFGNNFGGDKISKVPELLQAGMRRLVIDLWWDGTGLGWQLCPRINRDAGQLAIIRLALEQEQKDLQTSLQLQRMGSNQVVEEDVHPDLDAFQQELSPATATTTLMSSSALQPSNEDSVGPAKPTLSSDHKHTTDQRRRLHRTKHSRERKQGAFLEKRAAATIPKRVKTGSDGEEEQDEDEAHDKQSSRLGHPSRSSKSKAVPPATSTADKGANNGDKGQDKDTYTDSTSRKAPTQNRNRYRNRPARREWYQKKKPIQRPVIKPKGKAADQVRSLKNSSNSTATASTTPASTKSGINPQHQHRGGLHRLAMSKGMVSSYNKALATDQTVDGITCSTGEDIIMLLQGLQIWIQQTSEGELEDVLLVILNLNELGNNSLGSRPPSPSQPTPSPSPVPPPPINGTNVTNEDFFKALVSPNTNKTVKALLPNMISLKELFMDAFPSLIYSPTLLQMDRADLGASWWKSGPVGLDYYNTTKDPTTGRIQAPTGWPTSSYLTEVIKRRVVVGIGSNNLLANTTYNATDDFTTLYGPGVLGPSMANSSLIRISSGLSQNTCDFPVPGMMMVPTGTEESAVHIAALRNSSDSITQDVTWSFSSMSDSDLSPWTYSLGQTATTCGFSALVEGRALALSFSEQTAMTIWSWDLDQPPLNQTRSRDRRCGAMQSNGRWVVQDCNMKLPVACRQLNTSSNWIIYDKGAGNYRDVSCPDGYKFDVPRTARENHILYSTLLSYWNDTAPSFFTSLMNPFRELLDKGPRPVTAMRHRKRHHPATYEEEEEEYDNKGDDDDAGADEEEQMVRSSSVSNKKDRAGHEASENKGKLGLATVKDVTSGTVPPSVGGMPGGGMIWIDISSWQTAGCWVPGGVHGICPYQAPDNTVALQEIIKVSIIGGVIILVLVGMFLYLKCRRNVRLRKANKRRANVRNKIMRTEVETVPA